jgi:predicted phage tail protein
MNKIKLYGRLAEVYQEEFVLDVFSPAEAFRALNCQLPGWLDEIRRDDYYLIRELPNGQFALDERMLFIGMQNTTIHILPVAAGHSTKGVVKVVLGVGLIAASLFIPGMQGIGISIAGQFISSATIGAALGLSLLLGGAAMMLAPTPKLDTKNNNDNSFLFSGDISTASQGIPVPITYGTDRVRPIPIASQLVTNRIGVPGGGSYDGSSGSGVITFPVNDPSAGDIGSGGYYGGGGTGGSGTAILERIPGTNVVKLV